MQKYTTEQMINALKATKGMKTLAAQHLGCDYRTVQSYIEKFPTVAAAYAEIHERTGDTVELKLIEKVMSGDTTAIIFALKTKYRSRGYTERIELGVDPELLLTLIAAIKDHGLEPSKIFNSMIAELVDADRS